MEPPFKPGDLVSILPLSDCCDIGATHLYKTVEILMCERAPVDDAIAWDIDVKNCPYLIIYPHPDYDIVFSDPARDEVI